MRRLWRSTTLVAAGLCLAASLQAQAGLVAGFGGGLISPVKGDNSYPDGVKSFGYHIQAMLGFVPGSGRTSLRIDGQYGSVNFTKTASGQPKDKLFVLNADVVLHLTDAGPARPYFLAGPTFGHFNFSDGSGGLADDSETNVGFNGGIGLRLGRGEKVWFFTEGRYVYTAHHKYLPLTAGVRINLRQPYTKTTG